MDFRGWDELSKVEQLQCCISDAYKDAYGFRPRGVYNDENWNSEEFLTTEMNRLSAIIANNEVVESAVQEDAIARVEQQISKFLENGAASRKVAVLWLLDMHDCQGDKDYLCYTLNVPYGYFDKDL